VLREQAAAAGGAASSAAAFTVLQKVGARVPMYTHTHHVDSAAGESAFDMERSDLDSKYVPVTPQDAKVGTNAPSGRLPAIILLLEVALDGPTRTAACNGAVGECTIVESAISGKCILVAHTPLQACMALGQATRPGHQAGVVLLLCWLPAGASKCNCGLRLCPDLALRITCSLCIET
jgi:hypothetical protein